MYQTTTLDSGLRIVLCPSQSPVVYCGYAIAAGTRDELPGEEGLAHFCEHISFKGTRRRTALNILNALEHVGGDLNAFTTKEDTFYHAAVLRDNMRLAVDVLTDIVFCSTYPQAEIDREREVICDEIESYNDTPSDLIFDDFENRLFAGHPLGHNILGTAERVRSFTTADALRFTRRHYRPDNAVFFAYGDVKFDQLVRMIERSTGSGGSFSFSLSDVSVGTMKEIEPPLPLSGSRYPVSGAEAVEKGTHQAHVMTGCVAYSATDKRRLPLFLLNNLLGGTGMNARLNISLRERHGLVYTVESSMTCYGDTGLWAVYYGCDKHDVGRCRRLVRHELDRLVDRQLSASALAAAKRQIKGQIAIANDSRESFALSFAKSWLHHGWLKDTAKLFADIDALTANELQAVAAELFGESGLYTLLYK